MEQYPQEPLANNEELARISEDASSIFETYKSPERLEFIDDYGSFVRDIEFATDQIAHQLPDHGALFGMGAASGGIMRVISQRSIDDTHSLVNIIILTEDQKRHIIISNKDEQADHYESVITRQTADSFESAELNRREAVGLLGMLMLMREGFFTPFDQNNS